MKEELTENGFTEAEELDILKREKTDSVSGPFKSIKELMEHLSSIDDEAFKQYGCRKS